VLSQWRGYRIARRSGATLARRRQPPGSAADSVVRLVRAGQLEYAGKPQSFYGETSAQSSIIPCLDAALGIRHRNVELRVYLQAMRLSLS
jgi:hypothetical protein